MDSLLGIFSSSARMLYFRDMTQKDDTAEYYQASLKDGYRGLAGALIGMLLSETILYLAGIGGDVPMVFAAIGGVFSVRHILQIKQAKDQLRRLDDCSAD